MKGQSIAAFVLLIILIVGFVGAFVVLKGITGEFIIPAADLLGAALKGNKDACQDLQRTCGTDWRGCRGVSSRVRSACKPFATMSTSTPSLPAPTINIPTAPTTTPSIPTTAPKTPQVNVPTSIKPTLTKAQVWGKPVTSIRTCIKAPCPIGTTGIKIAIPNRGVAVAKPKTTDRTASLVETLPKGTSRSGGGDYHVAEGVSVYSPPAHPSRQPGDSPYSPLGEPLPASSIITVSSSIFHSDGTVRMVSPYDNKEVTFPASLYFTNNLGWSNSLVHVTENTEIYNWDLKSNTPVKISASTLYSTAYFKKEPYPSTTS